MVLAPKTKQCQPEVHPKRMCPLRDSNSRGLEAMAMNRHLTTRAIERARWFSELSTALDDGERLLAVLITEKVSPADTERLRLRLIELRTEVQRLNRVDLANGRVVGSTWPDRANHRTDQP
jgi:hypothetical protein